ncbi:MAG: ribbon-helix-helix protein, CopG family [archaeon]|nr:ribbon-helix-helix protein, CopG family [archaeon]
MTTTAYNISDEDIKKIKKISKAEDLNNSQVIRRAIKEYWENHYGTKRKNKS